MSSHPHGGKAAREMGLDGGSACWVVAREPPAARRGSREFRGRRVFRGEGPASAGGASVDFWRREGFCLSQCLSLELLRNYNETGCPAFGKLGRIILRGNTNVKSVLITYKLYRNVRVPLKNLPHLWRSVRFKR